MIVSDQVHISKFDESYIRIQADRSILMELSDRFSFTVPNANFLTSVKNKYWDGKIRLLNLRSGKLYLGLHTHVSNTNDEVREEHGDLILHRFNQPERIQPSYMIAAAAIGIAVNLYIAFGLSKGDYANLNERAVLLHVLGDVGASVAVIATGALNRGYQLDGS